MFFTLAISAATPAACAALTDRALVTDPAVMPIPGPAVVAWRSPDGRAALLHWGRRRRPGRSPARARPRPRARPRALRLPTDLSAAGGNVARGHDLGRIGDAGQRPRPGLARTSITRVDPVYVADVSGRGHHRRPRDLGGLDREPPRRPRPAARRRPAQPRLPARLGHAVHRRVRAQLRHHPAPAQRRPHPPPDPGRRHAARARARRRRPAAADALPPRLDGGLTAGPGRSPRRWSRPSPHLVTPASRSS